MEDLYGLADLRQYIGGGRPFFPPPALPPTHKILAADSHRGYMFNFSSDNYTTIAPPAPGVTMAPANTGGGDGGAGRWPRQETLTLLEIRSNLDPKFKEANQKGPLWDEVSRILCEEYGYQRSGKKCREKFENLYKYYKKTKSGRQDGKHYRFFRQLEALFDDQTNININNKIIGPGFQYEYIPENTNVNALTNNNKNNNQEPYSSHINISNSSDFDTLIPSDNDSQLNVNTFDVNDPKRKKKAGNKKGLEAKIKDTIDSEMKRMMEKQEAWMKMMMKKIEENEQERVLREEQWRKQDDERIERERKMWAGEKAWIEARDAAVMDAFGKLITGKEMSVVDSEFITRDDRIMCKGNWDCVSNHLIKERKEISRIVGGTMFDESSIGEQGINSCFRYSNGG